MRKQIATGGIIATGVVLFILSLLPAEIIINGTQSGISESFMLKGTARVAALVTGGIAFVLGMMVTGLWNKWTRKT